MANLSILTSDVHDNYGAFLPQTNGWIDARTLHSGLNIKTRFTQWIGYHLKTGHFAADVDYVIISQKWEKSGKTGLSKEVGISLFFAEHLAMLANTPEGHKIRSAYIKLRLIAMQLKAEIDSLRKENAMLKEPQVKRIRQGSRRVDVITTVTTVETIFGEKERRMTREQVPLDELPEGQQEAWRMMHAQRVQEGLSKRIRQMGEGLLLEDGAIKILPGKLIH